MKVTILGSGTSCGVPMIGCKCEVCTSTNPRNKRLRSSALIQTDSATFLIDCGPDFRQQALTHNITHIDAIFLTHSHSDHVAGIDDLRIFNFLQGAPMKIFASPDVLKDIKKRYDYTFNPPQIGGGVPELELHPVTAPFDFMGTHVTPLPIMHGKIPILGYRFDNFTYITDASYITEKTIEKIQNTQVLVLNALRREPHETHFSLGEALEVARRIAPRQTYFTHISHRLEHEATNHSLPPNAQLAYDGLIIKV